MSTPLLISSFYFPPECLPVACFMMQIGKLRLTEGNCQSLTIYMEIGGFHSGTFFIHKVKFEIAGRDHLEIGALGV